MPKALELSSVYPSSLPSCSHATAASLLPKDVDPSIVVPSTVPQAPLTKTSTTPETVPAESKDGGPDAVWRRIDVVKGSSPVRRVGSWPWPQVQAVLSSVGNPDGQLVHASAVVAPSTSLTVPSAQSWQSEELVEPSDGLKLPAAHGVHKLVPVASLKCPEAQGSHPSSAAFGCFPSSQTVVGHAGRQKLDMTPLVAAATVVPVPSLIFHDVSDR